MRVHKDGKLAATPGQRAVKAVRQAAGKKTGKNTGGDRAAAGELPPLRAEPTQARAKFTVDTIIHAASELLKNQGVDAVTTRNVAARAGVSVGAVYQYFPNKEAILMHISNMIMNQESADASPELFRLHRRSLDEMLLALFRRTVRTEMRLLGLGKDFYRHYARHMQFGRVQGLGHEPRSSGQLVDNMVQLLKRHPDEVGEPDTELAAFMIVRGVRMMLATLVEERPELLESESLVPMLARVARAMTAGEAPDGGAETAAAMRKDTPQPDGEPAPQSARGLDAGA
jgi:AcrR family transcriptional regulator